MTTSRTDTFEEVCAILRDVLGVEPDEIEIEIEGDMSLTDELGMESIDLVAVNTQLGERFGPQVNLAAHLAELDIDDVIALTVGDLIEFVDDALAHDRRAER